MESIQTSYEVSIMNDSNATPLLHSLSQKLTMYAHLPHDIDWSIESYKPILKMTTMEELLTLQENMNDTLVCNCMLFIMKQNIKPVWEDNQNRDGGALCFKVPNEFSPYIWRTMCQLFAGRSLCKDQSNFDKINGLSISPKKNFCIIKVWTCDDSIQSGDAIVDIDNLDKNVLYKKHNPEY